MIKNNARRKYVGIAVIGLLVAAGTLLWRVDGGAKPPPARTAIPVTVATAQRHDVPIFLSGLGTVQASNTVAIHSQVDGKLLSVNFKQGQQVHKGDTLAVIDPRPFQATLDQARGKKAQDQAQLISAQKDLDRFLDLAKKGYATPQSVDQQQAKVDQLKAAIVSDQAAIESAETQLSYATITAPLDGLVGFRQVDAGNIIHASDANPLTVLTQIRPSTVVFTLPQKDLARVREAMLRGKVPVLALDQDDRHQLAQGTLLLIDNEIDQSTSTIRLKAEFPNTDDRLWPGEFVNVRIQVDTRGHAVTIPPAAVQRGPQGAYTWVVSANQTVEVRPIEATLVNDGEITIVSKGIAAGDQVVVNGQYRLQAGTRVEATTDQAGTDQANTKQTTTVSERSAGRRE
jgi:multidrug efflux system membrane fusion protein